MTDWIGFEEAVARISVAIGAPNARELLTEAIHRGTVRGDAPKTEDIYRDAVNRYAGGLTYADLEADQNIREALFGSGDVSADDVRELIRSLSSTSDEPLWTSGAPGRPTVMDPIFAEFDRWRAESEPLPDTLAATATELRNWFINAYPKVRPPSLKTIKNQMRHRYNAAKIGPKN